MHKDDQLSLDFPTVPLTEGIIYASAVFASMRHRLYYIAILALVIASAAIAGCMVSPSSSPSTPPGVAAITEKPLYAHATWGWEVVDLSTGDQLASKNQDMCFTPGSTVKLFTTAAAMELLGPDYRFRTPVYLVGDSLVLVASGDLTMGGRTLPDDTIAWTDSDHGDANVLPDATLTNTDSLAGLNDLAAQVAVAGITRVSDVIIDDRLFRPEILDSPEPVTPVLVNDNFIDLLITPGPEDGTPASVATRPNTTLYNVISEVVTGGTEAAITISEEDGTITLTGSIPAGRAPLLRTWTVPDSSAWACGLFIEALERNGVAVDASPAGANPAGHLPDDYTEATKVAELVSPPFSGNVRHILTVSQNLHANTLLGIMAAHEGKTTLEEGIMIEASFLKEIGINPATISLIDGEGSSGNRVSPVAAVTLLQYMAGTDEYQVYRSALPILGVDGSLAKAAGPDNPAVGKIQAKTGTSIQGDLFGMFLTAKGLAGYMTTQSGREVAFAIYLNNVRVTTIEDIFVINSDMGDLAGVFWEAW